MKRWWFILLAVVLGWFTPAHALAHTRAVEYDAGPALEKVVLVAGITMDTSEGNQEDPLSLHKYLYCKGNPANRIDPSGHDDLVDLMCTMAIQSGLASMVSAVVSHAIDNAISKLVPKWVYEGLANSTPDAVTISGNVALNTVAFTGVGGGDWLCSTKNGNTAFYDYYGAGFNAGKSTSASISGAAGFVFNCSHSVDYTGSFLTVSVAYSTLSTLFPSVAQKFEAELPELTRIAGNIGVNLSDGILNKSSVNIFWSPGGGFYSSRGISFSLGTWQTSNNNSYGAFTYTEYTQLTPTDDSGEPQNVSFR